MPEGRWRWKVGGGVWVPDGRLGVGDGSGQVALKGRGVG